MQKTQPLVSVVVLNLNGKDLLRKCLKSVLRSDYQHLEIIVSDNGSTDKSQEMVREEFPNARLIENKKNLGFARGNNVAITVAEGEYIFLLNNDATVDRRCIGEALRAAQTDHRIGIVGCHMYSKQGIELFPIRGANLKPIEVPAVSGAALMAKRSVIKKIGLLDSDYFLFYEDADWCLRARKAGFRVIHVPTAIFWHHVGWTMARRDPIFPWYYYTRSRLIFSLKNLPTFLVLLLPLLEFYQFIRCMLRAIREHNVLAFFYSSLKAYCFCFKSLKRIMEKRLERVALYESWEKERVK